MTDDVRSELYAVAERTLTGSPKPSAIIEVALERLGAPAFVIGSGGFVHFANTAGRELLARGDEALVASLGDASEGRVPAVAMEVIPILEGDAPAQTWLAILSVSSADARIDAAVATCTARWGLTPKQSEVLSHIMRGLTNAAIASLMSCVERTVELHITALFDRAGVDSRAALVARALTL